MLHISCTFFSRGPNKYTRNWEDEDAYGKTTPGRGNNRRFYKNNEDFPALGNSKVNTMKDTMLSVKIVRNFIKCHLPFFFLFQFMQTASNKVEEPVISSAWYSSKNKTQNKTQNFPPLQSQDNTKSKPTTVSNTTTYVTIIFFYVIFTKQMFDKKLSTKILFTEMKTKYQMILLLMHLGKRTNIQVKIKILMEMVMQKSQLIPNYHQEIIARGTFKSL